EPTKNITGIIAIILSTLLLLTLWIYYIIDSDISGKFFSYGVLIKYSLIQWIASSIISLGTIILIIAGINLGNAVRIHSPVEETNLVTAGIYGIIRNPVVLGVFLYGFGILLLIPNLAALFMFITMIYGYNFKVNLEAEDLYMRFGEEWEKYCSRVGKYFPKNIKKQ
ncbi:MAG: isoprenylcysteine carboxylmethyltransferase family protein, partial [Bacteroidales bacterium]|nr:isoprenylcysteine carboxylmethyltransferase family protein [Bacteroidales bacterium]